MQEITEYLQHMAVSLWNFMNSGWFLSSILFIRLLLPKLINVFKASIGR